MQILEKCDFFCTMALGNFDGLHKAHIKIISSSVEYAKENGIKSGVLLFDCHTSKILGNPQRILTTMEEKLKILEEMGVDFVHIMHFDEITANMSGDKFIEYITKRFRVEAFFAGYDYKFGKNAGWDVEDLESYGKEHGFTTFITECIKEDGILVSSSNIREYIETGEVFLAKKLLGRPYAVLGEVVKGFGNGTKSLVPTANLKVFEDKLLPSDGVYFALTKIDDKSYKSAVNVGKNPTFNAKDRTIESFILDFCGEIYGKVLEIEFLEKIRDDRKFESIEALKEQIRKDIEKIRNINMRGKKYE